jgi:hypothetical protein
MATATYRVRVKPGVVRRHVQASRASAQGEEYISTCGERHGNLEYLRVESW